MVIELSALGTHWWITLPDGTSKSLVTELGHIINTFESNYSRFLESSLISDLNNNKILLSPPMELIHMLNYALDVYKATSGLFNISIGSELEKVGYGSIQDATSKVSTSLFKDIKISNDKITLSDTTRIDLGGFGKGWLIEKLSGYLKTKKVNSFVINGGGDIYSFGDSKIIYIEHPLNESEHVGELTLHNNSLASSSNIKRSWEKNSRLYSHIINPININTEQPLSIHICCDSILIADTFSTIFMIASRQDRQRLSKIYNLEFFEIQKDLSFFKSSGFKIKLNQ